MSLKLPRNWDFTALRSDTAKIVRSKSVIPAEGAQSHGWADVRRSMEKPLKKGWLKKQRSIVKNWKQCYFVLRGSNLTYHKDDRESVIQGNISLWESQVNELPSSAEDKFIFEIVPRKGSNGDRERDGCVLMAASQNEMEDWVRLIRRVIGAPTSAVFGKSLSDIIVYEKKLGPRLVPTLVEKCADFIREKGLDEEGIFRLPGQENQVKHFREAFDAGERPSFPSDTDVHTVASLLKLYLRELPEPVVPWSQYQAFLDSTLTLDAATALGKENLEHQISLLPRDNYNLLSYICRFLFEVQQHSKVNKMSVENLATVMGVNLFKPQVEDAITMMKGTPMIQKVMTVMIRHHKLLFPSSKDVAPPPPASKKRQGKKSSAPRNFVGWESAECDSFSLSESPEEEEGGETPEPKRRDDPGIGSGSEVTPSSLFSPSLSPLPTLDGWDGKDGSPRKRTQTLPSLGIPNRGRGAREDRWSRLQEAFDEKEERTLSEDIFKILDLQKVTLFPKKVFGERKSSEEEEEEEEKQALQSERKGSDVAVTPMEHPDESRDPQMRLQSNPEQSAPSLGSEEAEKQPAGAAPAQSQAMIQGSNTTDQQELITSLQQQNRELSATVAKLMSDLEAERSCSASLKVLLHNAERSRDEALRRNQQLDKHIQEFLSKANPGPALGP